METKQERNPYIWDYNIKVKTKDGTYQHEDLLELYRNYLFALQVREEYGEKYGDTDEVIKHYEKKLGIRRCRK
jgi:hypothetical protein